MAKRRKQAMVDLNSSGSESESNIESDLLSLAKKRKKSNTNKVSALSGSSDTESDWDSKSNTGKTETEPPNNELVKPDTEQEEGEVSDSEDDVGKTKSPNMSDSEANNRSSSQSSSSSESSSDSEFDDGYDENLMGDEEDRKRLSGLSEKERETEIFKRIEQRDIMRTRWEIERKLKMARRTEKAKKPKKKAKKSKKPSKKEAIKEAKVSHIKEPIATIQTNEVITQKSPSPLITDEVQDHIPSVENEEIEKPDSIDDARNAALDYYDHKERSKERKKNVEMNRTDDKRSNAMALLKAKREGKAKREEEEAKRLAQKERKEEKEELESVSGGKSSVKLKASEIYSDDSGSSDWEDDKPDKVSRSNSSKYSSESEDEEREEKHISLSTRDELNKIRLSRFKMERFINLPIFERTVMNCFVRISIGNNGQKPVYRVAEVVGVVETAKIYNLGKSRTNKGLRLKHGTQERVFRLEFISNQEFTESEFIKWKDICAQQNVPMPSMAVVERKLKDIKDAMNYEYKDEDVDKIIEEKNRFRNRPTNYAMKKTCLMKERDAAMLRGDYEIARELSQKIEELESRASELDKRRSSSISLISYINDRNRKRNVEDAEKAIMEEARANKGLRISDPFTRRITQPRMGFKQSEKKEDELPIKEPIIFTEPPKKQSELIETSKGNDKKNYNLYTLHDFDIDLDVSVPVNTVNTLPKPVPKLSEPTTKRSLNLEDYKKKRGLI
uniref:Plus3 domain-containing protein n=1 Tax=Glossina pallidipes TaxID=7398 RepID=A0A1A9ZR98_GLOPL